MGTEFRVQRRHGLRPDDIEPLLCSKQYRGFDDKLNQHLFGFTGQVNGQDVPEFTVWFDKEDLGITAYDMSGTSWDDLSAFLRILAQDDPTLRITTWDDDEDMASYFH